jgi:alkylhydroperoxidase/carboxymuconolactone decarboxylase family protein YurZ
MPSGSRGGRYRALGQRHPEVVSAYETLAAACRAAGPLEARDIALLKVAVSIGRGSWRSVHAHARKALEAGVAPDALRHLVILSLPTIGLPATLDAQKWVEEAIAEQDRPPGA